MTLNIHFSTIYYYKIALNPRKKTYIIFAFIYLRVLIILQRLLISYVRKVCVRTVDTDVVVMAIAHYNNIKPNELWVAFGTGSHFRYIIIINLPMNLLRLWIQEYAPLYMYFMPFTGCDIVSSFGGRGKKTAWVTWQSYPKATGAFEDLLLLQDGIDDHTLSDLERFVVLLYDRTSDITIVNDCWKQLFTGKSRILENLPHKRRQHYSNMWNGPLIKPSAGPRPNCWPQAPKPPKLGLKERLCVRVATILDHICQKHHSHAMN